jgi:hypothetical protein
LLIESRDRRRALIRGAYDQARTLIDHDPFHQAVIRDLVTPQG